MDLSLSINTREHVVCSVKNGQSLIVVVVEIVHSFCVELFCGKKNSHKGEFS